MGKDFVINKETGKYKYSEEGIKKRSEYHKKNYVSISFTMKPEDYDIFKEAADKSGDKFATWVQKACEAMMTE